MRILRLLLSFAFATWALSGLDLGAYPAEALVGGFVLLAAAGGLLAIPVVEAVSAVVQGVRESRQASPGTRP
ncbi:hypothetical protein [Pseudodesulfovibrio pelocollis]|uniref:hypothetical protein n=1 Tax=Pseudodesulfovibrio pelocollis TaxID=3051432 RepID=UPI00255B195B|nr:hypothetical protein [Pseudodesulfovibrio sp. SB368]